MLIERQWQVGQKANKFMMNFDIALFSLGTKSMDAKVGNVLVSEVLQNVHFQVWVVLLFCMFEYRRVRKRC